MQDTLREERRVIIVMTFNDDSSASRPPPSSPSVPACPPSACVSSCRPSCCPPRRTTTPWAWRPSPARRRARAYLRRAGDECEDDGEHGGLLGGRADHPRVRAAVGGDSPSGRGLLTLEMDTSKGVSDQVRRAGDHGLHALLRAAHPERRAPRVPEADHVLGRRGPAGRPAPAQGAAGEGHGGDEGGRSCLPHRYTTSLYHLAIPHRSTTSASAVVCPMR